MAMAVRMPRLHTRDACARCSRPVVLGMTATKSASSWRDGCCRGSREGRAGRSVVVAEAAGGASVPLSVLDRSTPTRAFTVVASRSPGSDLAGSAWLRLPLEVCNDPPSPACSEMLSLLLLLACTETPALLTLLLLLALWLLLLLLQSQEYSHCMGWPLRDTLCAGASSSMACV